MCRVVERCVQQAPQLRAGLEDAEPVAAAVADAAQRLDDEIGQAVEHWRLERVGLIEQNILRLAILELETAAVPPKVTISEAVRLAHWFAGAKAPAFVNGVLDAVARRAGRL
jgi:N utilization substance protein B